MKTFLKVHFVIVHKLHYQASLAEWSKASDLSSDTRTSAWVRTPHLTERFLFDPSSLDRSPPSYECSTSVTKN